MTPVAIVFLTLSIVIVWGGALASTLFLRRRPEVEVYSPGAPDDRREDAAPIEHDT